MFEKQIAVLLLKCSNCFSNLTILNIFVLARYLDLWAEFQITVKVSFRGYLHIVFLRVFTYLASVCMCVCTAIPKVGGQGDWGVTELV